MIIIIRLDIFFHSLLRGEIEKGIESCLFTVGTSSINTFAERSEAEEKSLPQQCRMKSVNIFKFTAKGKPQFTSTFIAQTITTMKVWELIDTWLAFNWILNGHCALIVAPLILPLCVTVISILSAALGRPKNEIERVENGNENETAIYNDELQSARVNAGLLRI